MLGKPHLLSNVPEWIVFLSKLSLMYMPLACASPQLNTAEVQNTTQSKISHSLCIGPSPSLKTQLNRASEKNTAATVPMLVNLVVSTPSIQFSNVETSSVARNGTNSMSSGSDINGELKDYSGVVFYKKVILQDHRPLRIYSHSNKKQVGV
ncbi:uncharacterized protein LOC141876857 isoform X2 [Acropora palmata]|uniref:uncharacterized protein LOC141876857 isoform X2 n=1 Tax=Acropora palmata TaxID=6131 RepID=UPI003DA1A83E